MPKSDTWPGGFGLETMTGMDSAGSCDSVVSANSGFSDDSLEHLSAEEKACLMFLEETIESLDTEEDSGLSNDEPDQLALSGNLTTKMATLSASMNSSKLNSELNSGLPKHVSKEPIKETSKDQNPIHSYLIPTPFIVANSSNYSQAKAKPGFPPDKKNVHPKPQFTSSKSQHVSHHNQQRDAPPVPSEVNVVVIPPPTKPKDSPGRTAEGPSPRGPLSYEALIHLRRSASMKKSPLCPTLDHTIDVAKHPPTSTAGIHPNHLPRVPSGIPTQEPHRPKTSPPAVAPKPQRFPANISVNPQNGTGSSPPDSSSSGRYLLDPNKVRMEALQKLGLLKDKEPENEAVTRLSKSQTSRDLSAKRFVRDPFHANPSRSPSFSYSHVRVEPKSKPLQASASFHSYSRSEQPSATILCHSQTSGVKASTLERSGVGLGRQVPSQPASQPPPASVGSHKIGGYCPEPGHAKAPEPAKTATAAQPAPRKASNPLGYSVMMIPGMGADRKEALRKLGLLKD